MTMFNGRSMNLLPYDGTVHYYEKAFRREEALSYYNRLLGSIAWKNDEVVMFGKRIITKRETAWYGDGGYLYTYSKTTRQALAWTTDLLELKQRVETLSSTTFNACLLNLYHNGDEGMTWHSDDESSLRKNATIASLSLGAARSFSFRHKKTKETLSLLLENGSLLLMKDDTQTNWLHALPKSKKTLQPRINLTFRTMVE